MCVCGGVFTVGIVGLAWQVKRITAGHISGGTGRLEGERVQLR